MADTVGGSRHRSSQQTGGGLPHRLSGGKAELPSPVVQHLGQFIEAGALPLRWMRAELPKLAWRSIAPGALGDARPRAAVYMARSGEVKRG